MASEPLSRRVTLTELRLATGRSRHLVMKMVEEGAPVVRHPANRGSDYIFDLGDLLRWSLDRLDGRIVVGDDGEKIDFDKERARLTREQADKLARERLADERETVRAAPIAAALAAQDQGVKDRLLMVPLSAAAEALAAGERAGAPGVADVYADHITRALADLASGDIVARAAAP